MNPSARSGHAPAAQLKPLDGFESHRVCAVPAAQRVYLAGRDSRGAIYAIYTFSEHMLGVPPLHFWSSWQPAARGTVVVPPTKRRSGSSGVAE